MKLTILKAPTKEDWILVKQAAFVTIGKETETEPSLEWKRRILQAVHSPIRELRYVVLMEDLPSWVSVHLVRHIHAQPYVSTQRNDRCDRDESYDRRKAPQDTPVKMIWSFNAEELMTICHKRLCFHASKETRQVILDICKEIIKLCPEFQEINVLVPLCVYRGGVCTDFAKCEYYKKTGHGYISPKLHVRLEPTFDEVVAWLEKHGGEVNGDNFVRLLNAVYKDFGDTHRTRDLTDEEADIYDQWLNSEAEHTGETLWKE